MKKFYALCAFFFIVGAVFIAFDVFGIALEKNRTFAFTTGVAICAIAATAFGMAKACNDYHGSSRR